MNRITIDTNDLRTLSRSYMSESEVIANIRLDLLRAWSDVAPGAYPGVERLMSWADEINSGLARLSGTIDNEASDAQFQALRADDSDLLGEFVSVLLCGLGLLGAMAGRSLAPWLPVTAGEAPLFEDPISTIEVVMPMPSTATGFGAVDPLGSLGTQNGALAPISDVLGQVQQLSNDPLGFLDGPQGQALAASEMNAVAPIQGLLDQTRAVLNNPLGFNTAALNPSPSSSPLGNLENAALQNNINRILSGGSFPGSNIAGAFSNNSPTNPLSNLNGFVNGLLTSAHSGAGGGGAPPLTSGIATQFIHTNPISDPFGSLNPGIGIAEHNISDANVNGILAGEGVTSGFGLG